MLDWQAEMRRCVVFFMRTLGDEQQQAQQRGGGGRDTIGSVFNDARQPGGVEQRTEV